MIFLTRKETFCAAHKLFREEWSEQKNAAVFGQCANPNWHGHNYELYVTVKGEPDPITSFVINLHDLSEILKKCVIEKLDHHNINLDVDFMQGKMATTEMLVVAIWEQLEEAVNQKGCRLHCVKVRETEKNYIEYYGKGN